VFTTPPLEPGYSYSYTLVAEVVRDGQRHTATERVSVEPGRETTVSLNVPTTSAVAAR
jgi:uncharacterized protein (TIGR03000 family)